MNAALVAISIFTIAIPAHAIDLDLNRPRDPIARNSLPDLQILENRQQRLNVQQRQQIYREIDRDNNMAPVERPEIPRVRQNCQIQAFGSSFSRGGCR